MSVKTTRRRRGDAPNSDTPAETPALARESADRSPAPGRGADRNGDRRPARGDRRAAPAPRADRPMMRPELDDPNRVRIDLDDLQALASMGADDLAALMEGSVTRRALSVGTQVEGRVTRIGREATFVDIGGKSDAWIDRGEVEDVKVGDLVTAFVISSDEDGVRLSIQLRGDAAAAFLDEAAESGVPVEGRISGHNAGGFEVRVGSVRAFCPFSQMERGYNGQPEEWIGKTLPFLVLESDEKIVLSRRALVAREAEAAAEDMWTRLAEGQELDGTVTSVQAFGAFVDLGGVDGLVPRRELGGGADVDPASMVTKGQALRVRVIALDHANRRITLTPAAGFESPWTQRVGTEIVVGGSYTGRVVRVEEFGAFVNLAPGIDGLLHPSRITGGRSGMPSVGSDIQVKVADIDEARKRIALASADWEDTSGSSAKGAMLTGTIREVLRNGVALDMEDGRTGWLPEKQVELPAGTVMAQRFRRGKRVTARVIEEDVGGRRVTLSLLTQQEEGPSGAWRSGDTGGGFGTLAELLKGFKK